MVCELFMTPTAELADIVLPVATWLERDEPHTTQADWDLPLRQKAVEPLGESKSDWQILLELGRKLGFSKQDFPDLEMIIEEMIRPSGVSYEELKKKGWVLFPPMRSKKYKQVGFSTPSGKFELYSKVLEQLGYDPLPHYGEPPESPTSTPEVAKEFPLVLTTGGRIPSFFHSEHRQIERLRRRNPDPLVEINSDTAKELGIESGDWVWIETRRGRIKQRAKLTTEILPEVIAAQHCWWFPEDKRVEPSLHGVWESNLNVLTSGEQADEAMGSVPHRGLLCKIHKVEG